MCRLLLGLGWCHVSRLRMLVSGSGKMIHGLGIRWLTCDCHYRVVLTARSVHGYTTGYDIDTPVLYIRVMDNAIEMTRSV